MSDRIAVMNKGRYEQLGDPESLYERPKTRFVAGFLGVSNLLAGQVEDRGGAYATVRLSDDTRIRVPSGLVNGRGDVRIGVRPEKIRLHGPSAEAPANHNQLRGVVRDASYLGVSTQYQVEARGGTALTVYEQNVERATRAELWARGDEVQMTWSPDHSFVVQPEGEAAINDAGGGTPATTTGSEEPAATTTA